MTLAANRLTLVTLTVTDLPRARAYYEALGWQPEQTLEEVAFYALPGMKLGLFTRAGLAAETGLPVKALGTGAVTLAQNQPDRAAVDAAYQRALDSGAQAIRAPFATDWGGYSCYVADPDGHLWEFAHNPFWPLDDKGFLE